MAAQIKDVIQDFETVINDARNKKARVDYASNEAFWLLSYGKALHPKRIRLKVTSITEQTDTIKTIRFSAADGYLPPFTAGQYLVVFVEIDGVRTGRPISISSAPSERAYYELTIKRKEDGFVSDYFLDKVKVGDEFDAASPKGNFYYNPVIHGKDLVFIAGGSGITPFLSIIRDITNKGKNDVNIHLFYGCRNQNDVPYLEELQGYADRYENIKLDLVLSEPTEGWDGLTGFISADLIQKAGVDVDHSTFYLCGPKGLYDFCTAELERLNVPKRRLRHEVMGAPAKIWEDPAWPEEVAGDAVFTIEYGDKKISAKACEPLLVAFERAGIHVEFSCRSGECSLCRVKLLDGKVFQTSTALVRRADCANGYIHSCVSYPISDLKIMEV